jgi:hypothetical protein
MNVFGNLAYSSCNHLVVTNGVWYFIRAAVYIVSVMKCARVWCKVCKESPRFKAVENYVGHVSILFYGCLENAISGNLFMFVDVAAVFQDMKVSNVLAYW